MAVAVTYLETREVDIAKLTPFPGNAKRGDIPKIRESLRRGQYRSLVVRAMPNGWLVVLAGNNTLKAMIDEGWEHARCEIIECDDDQARRINVADNAIGARGTIDNSALAEIMSLFAGDYEGTGFDAPDVEQIMAGIPGYGALPTVGRPTGPPSYNGPTAGPAISPADRVDANAVWRESGMPDYSSQDRMPTFSTTVHFGSHEDADEFFRMVGRQKMRSWWYPEDDGFVGQDRSARVVAEPAP